MTQSQTTEKSVGFFLGQSGTLRTDAVRSPQALKLSPQAKALLEQCNSAANCSFIHEYGLHYIYSMTYGRSFLGSFTLWDKKTSKSSSLDVMAKFSVSAVYYSASASAEFMQKQGSSSESLSMVARANWVGGANIDLDNSSPKAMKSNTYAKWIDTSYANPGKLYMEYRDWIDTSYANP